MSNCFLESFSSKKLDLLADHSAVKKINTLKSLLYFRKKLFFDHLKTERETLE